MVGAPFSFPQRHRKMYRVVSGVGIYREGGG